MSDSITVEVKGLKELAAALQDLPVKVQGKALGAAVKAGAEIVRNQAQANAKAIFDDPTGATFKSIVAYAKRGNKPYDISYEVGVTMKKKWPRRRRKAASGATGRTAGGFSKKEKKMVTGEYWPAFWWRFTEFNTTRRQATPWLRPAFDTRSADALTMIKKMLAAAVEIAANAVNKYRG